MKRQKTPKTSKKPSAAKRARGKVAQKDCISHSRIQKNSSKNNSKPLDESCQGSKSKKKKNISLSEVMHKVVDAVVKPIKAMIQPAEKKDDVDVPFAENRSTTELTTSMKFFYSNDRFIETFDDRDIYIMICNRWPALHEECKALQHKRSAILEMLADESFMRDMSQKYEMNAFDVVRFLFRLCPSLFKGIFVKKVQNVVNGTQYAKKLKKHKYRVAKSAKGVSRRRAHGF